MSAGSRLIARSYTGAGVHDEFAYLEDPVLGARCTFERHADGNWRCIPESNGRLYELAFLDRRCSQPVILADLSQTFASIFEPTADEDLVRVGRLGARVAIPARAYRKTDGRCEGFETEGGAGRRWSEIPARQLVRAVELDVALGTRLAERVLRGDDGSTAPLIPTSLDPIVFSDRRTYVDTQLGTVVEPTRTRWSEAFRGDVAWTTELAYTDTTTFTNATCQSPLVSAYDHETVAARQQLQPGSCTLDAALYSLTPAEETFAREGGTCVSQGQLPPDDDASMALGTRIDSRFLKGTLAPRAVQGARYVPLEIRNTDRSRIQLAWFDREIGLPCDVIPADDPRQAYCAFYVNRDLYRFFSDAECKHRVIAIEPTAIEAQSCYAGPAPRVIVGNHDDDLPDNQFFLAIGGRRLPDHTLVYISGFADGRGCSELNDGYTLFELASERLITLPTLTAR